MYMNHIPEIENDKMTLKVKRSSGVDFSNGGTFRKLKTITGIAPIKIRITNKMVFLEKIKSILLGEKYSFLNHL
jgi:hypothetical protein